MAKKITKKQWKRASDILGVAASLCAIMAIIAKS